MCGINGIIKTADTRGVDRCQLEKMNALLDHRGPDGAGVWVSASGKVGFGHTRLAIVDLDREAQQPMTNEDGSIWLTYNGEIYNAPQLRAQLQRNHVFKTDHSDTEVLVHGYEEWGMAGLLQRVNGIFAFALHDEREQRSYLVRDKLGIKPLYIRVNGEHITFASEIKAILGASTQSTTLSHDALYHYLTFLCAPAPLTLFRDIYKLPPATYMEVTSRALSAHRYWSPAQKINETMTETQAVEATQEAVKKAVERQKVADVEVGAFLSGGVDSSTIVSLLSDGGSRKINTFTVSFTDHQHLNETEFAEQIARQFSTNHFDIRIDQQDMRGYIDELSYTQDEPIADWVCIPLNFVAQAARDSETKVVLVGEGADELFCGYPGYVLSLNRLHQHWRPFQKLPPLVQKGVASALKKMMARNINGANVSDNVFRAAHGRMHFWTGATLFWETTKQLLIEKDALKHDVHAQLVSTSGLFDTLPVNSDFDSFVAIERLQREYRAETHASDELAGMTYRELKLRLAELLLMRVDKITMAHSIEARVPFLDEDLVHLAMSMPRSLKIKDNRTKHILKEAVQTLLPESIINRPKVGFGAPMSDWLREEFGSHVSEAILDSDLMTHSMFKRPFIESLLQQHRRGEEDYGVYIWALFNLCQWASLWKVKAA